MMDILLALINVLNAISALQSDNLGGFMLAFFGLIFEIILIIIDLF